MTKREEWTRIQVKAPDLATTIKAAYARFGKVKLENVRLP